MLTELERLIESRRRDARLDGTAPLPLTAPVVRLTVAERVVPAVAPPELAESVVRIPGHDDWALRSLIHGDLETYLRWRTSWETSHSLGSVASLRRLDTDLHAAGITVPSEVRRAWDRLVAPTGTNDGWVDLSELDLIGDVVGAFGDHVRSRCTTALGLVETSPTVKRTGLLRAWSTADLDTTELVERNGASVRLDDGRLTLAHDGGRSAIVGIREFSLGVDGAVVTDATGRTWSTDEAGTDALCAVAPEATAWRVRTVPEILVHADLIAALESASAAVRRCGRSARIVLGDARHTALVAPR